MLKRERDEEKERERERKKRRKRKYGQAKLKHAKRGVLSCILNGIAAVIFIAMLATAYNNAGTTAVIVGSFGMSALVLSVGGLYVAIRGFKEREKDYITCKVGVVLSGIMIAVFVGVFCRGLF